MYCYSNRAVTHLIHFDHNWQHCKSLCCEWYSNYCPLWILLQHNLIWCCSIRGEADTIQNIEPSSVPLILVLVQHNLIWCYSIRGEADTIQNIEPSTDISACGSRNILLHHYMLRQLNLLQSMPTLSIHAQLAHMICYTMCNCVWSEVVRLMCTELNKLSVDIHPNPEVRLNIVIIQLHVQCIL